MCWAHSLSFIHLLDWIRGQRKMHDELQSTEQYSFPMGCTYAVCILYYTMYIYCWLGITSCQWLCADLSWFHHLPHPYLRHVLPLAKCVYFHHHKSSMGKKNELLRVCSPAWALLSISLPSVSPVIMLPRLRVNTLNKPGTTSKIA